MNSISISELKASPNKQLKKASDFPLVIQNRNKIAGYLIGKELFENLVAYIEDVEDQKAIKATDPKEGQDLNDVLQELGLGV